MGVEGAASALNRVTVRIRGDRFLGGGEIHLLQERRDAVAPVAAIVGREREAALVEAGAAVVLAGDERIGIRGVVDDFLFCLAPVVQS